MEFNRKKILTIATCEQAHAGQKGWFGDDLDTLRCKTHYEKPEELTYINDSSDLYPFGNKNDCYAYFYPEESYEMRPSFRPFSSEELNQLVGKVVKRKAGESAGKRSLVTNVDCGKVVIGGNHFITAVNLLEFYVLDDGTPCGVEEEKDQGFPGLN